MFSWASLAPTLPANARHYMQCVNAETCVPIMQQSPPSVSTIPTRSNPNPNPNSPSVVVSLVHSACAARACLQHLSSHHNVCMLQWREPFHVAWRFALSQFDKVACSRSFLKLDPNVMKSCLSRRFLRATCSFIVCMPPICHSMYT